MNYLLEEVMQERDRLRREREAAVVMLRIECAAYDDNDWPDNLHLDDVGEVHLARSAYEEVRSARERYARLEAAMQRLAEPGGWQTPEITNAIAREALGELAGLAHSSRPGPRSHAAPSSAR